MSIRLGEILFPLRYDVVAQSAFTRLFNRHFASDLQEVARDPLYTHIEATVGHERKLCGLSPYYPEGREATCEAYYKARLIKLIGLHRSLAGGWDYTQDRLVFIRPREGMTTSLGHPLPEGAFLANGQHRMITLFGMGIRELDDEQYGYKDATHNPLEMTGLYMERGLITQRQFVDFARLRFSFPKRIKGVRGLSTWAARSGPDWLCEYIEIYWGKK